jgi:membrane protein DedA with SNARE-associated domain
MPHHVAALLATTDLDNKWWTLLVVLVGEALSWAGIPMIGAAAVGAVSVAASQGVVSIWSVVIFGTLGAELGGLLGWWIGKRVAERGRGPDGGRRDRALSAGERVRERWGRLMVFMVPSWVSGALAMPFKQFAIWNSLAAFLWTVAAAFGAYGVGSAISGGDLREIVLSLLAAAAACGLIALLALRHRHRHRGEAETAPPVPKG